MDIRENLEKEIERVHNKMSKAVPGTEEYTKHMAELERLIKMLESEDRIELEKLDSQSKRDLDEAKQRLAEEEASHNFDMARKQAEIDQANAAGDREVQDRDSKRGLAKTIIGVGAMVVVAVFTVCSEETRIVTSKAMTVATKVIQRL